MTESSGIHTDLSGQMTYSDYLHLDQLLSCQQRKSDHHDEMLFIIIHQASELWLKLALHEVTAAIDCLHENELEQASKILARVCRIQQQLIQSWDVLSTLTPAEYAQFRDQLGHASGFQSWQNRLLEFSLGHKNRDVVRVFAHDAPLHSALDSALRRPSIYDAAIQVLSRDGFAIDRQCLERDWSEDYRANPSVERAWIQVYRHVDQYWELYELAEKLMDVEDKQQQWRYHHMKTVERIIGHKRGTGGSSGVSYLKQVLDHRFFPELWSLRTQL